MCAGAARGLSSVQLLGGHSLSQGLNFRNCLVPGAKLVKEGWHRVSGRGKFMLWWQVLGANSGDCDAKEASACKVAWHRPLHAIPLRKRVRLGWYINENERA